MTRLFSVPGTAKVTTETGCLVKWTCHTPASLILSGALVRRPVGTLRSSNTAHQGFTRELRPCYTQK